MHRSRIARVPGICQADRDLAAIRSRSDGRPRGNEASKKIRHARLRVVVSTKGIPPTHEADMAAGLMNFDVQSRIVPRGRHDTIEHLCRQERIIPGTEQQSWPPDACEELHGTGTGVVVDGASESMQRCGNHVVEREKRVCTLERVAVDRAGVRPKLCACLGAKSPQKVPTVYTSESTFDVPRAPLEVVRYRNSGCASYLYWSLRSLLTKPFEQHVSPE